MRALYLKISAFGPYRNTVEIDFAQFGTSGLYLVTGDTGAGKTTIFDAICFALYGEPSGDMRKPDMLRSKYVEDKEKTQVEFRFELKRKIYTVSRVIKGGKTGGKDAVLTCPDGTVISKSSDVNRSIEELLGINREQFTKIAMVAQGEFLKFLVAKSDDKKLIFRTLFQTENFDKLRNVIDEKTKKAKSEQDTKEKEIQFQLESVSIDPADALYAQEWMDLRGKTLEYEEAYAYLQQYIAYQEETEKTLNTQREEHNAYFQTQKDRLTLAKQQGLLIGRREGAQTRFLQKKVEEEQAKSVLSKAKAKEAEGKALQQQATGIQAMLPQYAQLEQVQTQLHSEEVEQKQKQIRFEQINALWRSSQASIADAEKKLEMLQGAGEMLARLEAEQKEVEKEGKDLSALLENIKSYYKYEVQCNAYRLQRDEKNSLYNQALQQHAKLRNLYINASAGRLAKELKEGEPCMVCGSTVHPHKASVDVKIPDTAELDDAERLEKTAKEAYDEIKSQHQQCEGGLQALGNQIKQQAVHLLKMERAEDIRQIQSAVQDAVADKKQKWQNITNAIRNEKSNLEAFQKLNKQKKEWEQQELQQRKTVADLEKDLARLQESIKGKKENSEKLIAQLPFATRALAESKMTALQAQSEQLQKNIENAVQAMQRIQTEISALDSEIRTLSAQIQEVERIDILALQNDIDALERKGKVLESKQQNLYAGLNGNRRCARNLSVQLDEHKKLSAYYANINTLNKTLSGGLGGKEKLDLETFVQISYFDTILKKANRHLQKMTNGQYELQRRVDTDSKQGKIGLDLDVMDYYNSSRRDVKTLSGGESFKASLSLAFGLSEVVQSYAGGIELGTLFIDEGFGTLDEESLKSAMEALLGISTNNRIVGIISHVAELKQRIDKQVIVRKDRFGNRTIETKADCL